MARGLPAASCIDWIRAWLGTDNASALPERSHSAALTSSGPPDLAAIAAGEPINIVHSYELTKDHY